MANRFTARLERVLEKRSESAALDREAEGKLDALAQSYQQRVSRIFAELDAKDPCWRCENVTRDFKPLCVVDQAPVPSGGCKRKQRCTHAG